ncbi:MAG: hypothetical protein HYY84_07730 [Deltaproteobacteria bacterium]|nr:hypothetical protein [Deltaproteobacteria bacterium]
MDVSKLVVDRQKSSRSVVAAAQTHAERAGEGVALLLGADHKAPAVAMIRAMGNKLGNDCDAMVRADEAHTSELADDRGQRDARDLHAEEVRSTLVEVREVVTAMFGADFAAALGFVGNTPRDPDQLVGLGGRVLDNMRQKGTPAPRFPGMCFDATYWAGRLTAAVGPLKAALGDVAREERENEATYVAKTKAIEAYDQTFSQVATYVSAMLAIAGEKELSRRVRPSSRRPGQTDEVAATDGVATLPPVPTPITAAPTPPTAATPVRNG